VFCLFLDTPCSPLLLLFFFFLLESGRQFEMLPLISSATRRGTCWMIWSMPPRSSESGTLKKSRQSRKDSRCPRRSMRHFDRFPSVDLLRYTIAQQMCLVLFLLLSLGDWLQAVDSSLRVLGTLCEMPAAGHDTDALLTRTLDSVTPGFTAPVKQRGPLWRELFAYLQTVISLC
jgi:hypothetical protein